jgi:hypothetical protein
LNDTFAPPSFPCTIRFGSLGAIHRSWWSLCGVRIVSGNVRPPSRERKKPTFDAYTTFESRGSAVRPE